MMIDRATTLRLGALAAAAMALSACGGGGGSTTVVPPVVVPAFACQFGTGFCTDFAAAANSTPAPLAAGDIVPVSLTATPIPFPTGG